MLTGHNVNYACLREMMSAEPHAAEQAWQIAVDPTAWSIDQSVEHKNQIPRIVNERQHENW